MMYELVRHINAVAVTHFHDAALCPVSARYEKQAGFEAVWRRIEEDHRCNALLWIEEDKARRIDVADAYIAASKRRIDRYNEQRSDAVQAIDEGLLETLGHRPRHNGARLHSETPGTIIDRLSVLSLKIHHMRGYAGRPAAGNAVMDGGRSRLASLVEQRVDLARCFDELIAGAALGLVYYKVYRPRTAAYNDRPLGPYPFMARNDLVA